MPYAAGIEPDCSPPVFRANFPTYGGREAPDLVPDSGFAVVLLLIAGSEAPTAVAAGIEPDREPPCCWFTDPRTLDTATAAGGAKAAVGGILETECGFCATTLSGTLLDPKAAAMTLLCFAK